MSGFDSYKLQDGSVNQAAVRCTPDVPEALQEMALGGPVRATVLAVYYPEEDDRTGGDWAVTCDVRTLGDKQRYIPRVPVYPLVAGLYDEDDHIPRAASIDINQGSLATESGGPKAQKPSEAASTDADIVMLWFEDGDFKKPFIMPFGPPHPKRKNKPSKAAGRVRRIRHNGTIIEIDKDGNVTIDASAAKTDALTASGAQVANPSGGNILIKTNATPGLLSLQEATDAIVKGTTFWNSFQGVMTALSAWAAAAAKATAKLEFIPPAPDLIAAIQLFVAAAPSWLSARVKTG